MKQFIISNNSCGIRLTEEHLQWLRANGHPEATINFCDDDRSNPALIACIEAIRAKRQPLIDVANMLQEIMVNTRKDNDYAFVALSAQIDKLLLMLSYKSYHKNRIICEIRKVLNGGSMYEATIYANPKEGIAPAQVRKRFEVLCETFNRYQPAFKAVSDATESFHRYIEANNLAVRMGQISYSDGFEIKSYDETRFVAEVYREYAENYGDEDHEFMKLKPFLTREVVAAFVETGDTDGLMSYLKSLNIGNFMEIRDDLSTAQNATPITLSPEDQAAFDAIMASLS